jgi:hypothetical protein
MSVETERFLFCFHEMTSSTFPSFVVFFSGGRKLKKKKKKTISWKETLMTLETTHVTFLLASKRHLNARKREGSN